MKVEDDPQIMDRIETEDVPPSSKKFKQKQKLS